MPGGRPPTKPQPKFGQRLALIRARLGLSQTEFGQRLGLSREMVAYYERCATNPSTDFVEKAATALKVPVTEFLGQAMKPARKPGPPSRMQELTEKLSELPRTKQRVVLEMLEGFLQKTTNGHKQAA